MLSEYKNQIGLAAGVFTIVQLLSPVLLCKDIMKRGSTTGVSIMPFVGGLVLSTVFVQNALLIQDEIMLYVNVFAMLLGLGYISVYYLYTKEKVQFFIKMGKAVILLAVLISYAQRENPDVVKFRFGLITTFILFALIASPLLRVETIMKTRNTDSLPMPLILSGSLVAFSWLLYGIAIEDSFVQIQNIAALFLQAFQIGLYLYIKLVKPPKKASGKGKKKN